MRPTRPALVALAGIAGAALLSAQPSAGEQGTERLLIANVTVIDAVQGARPAMDVEIADGEILAVRNHRGESPEGAIDGTDRFLIPGLWDAHVHFDYEPDLAPAMFNLFLANGITSVRDTGGQLDAVMPWKHHAESGEVPAPAVYVAGPLIDGVPRVYDGSAPFRPNLGAGVATPEEAVQLVDALVEEGVDLLKAYELLTPEAFAAVVKRAAHHGKPVTGHPPLSMDTALAAAALDSVEHLRNLDLACSAEADELLTERRAMLATGAANGGELRGSIHAAQRPRSVETFSETRCQTVAEALAEAGSWQVPTLTIGMARVNRLYARDDWRANFVHLPEPVRSTWTQGALGMVDDQPDAPTVAHGEWTTAMVARLAEAGVPIMAGTDTPIFFLTPGFSLHEELANLVDAGLTPTQALEAATLTPARYFGLEDVSGAVAPGMVADLVLLDANPLEDIRNTTSIRAVFRAGQVFDRGALDDLLRDAKAGNDERVAGVLQSEREGHDWPRILGPTGDSKSAETGILMDWPETGPPLVWERPAGEGYAGAVVAGDRLFFFDRHDDTARLVCLDARTGEEHWRSEYPTFYEDYYDYSVGPRASPVVDGSRVFTFGVEGRLRAHAVEDGELLWEVDTAAEFNVVKNFFGVGASPVIEGDLLIAQVGGSPPDAPRIHSGGVTGNGTGIVAFDKATGEVRYAVSDELASYSSPVLTTIDGRRWGFVFARGGLIGFDPGNGEIDFHFPWKSRLLESVNASAPQVVGNTVFITEAYGPGAALLRVEPGGYEVIWQDGRRNQALASHFGNNVYHEGTLYGSHGRNSGPAEFRAIDFMTGEILWSEPDLLWATQLFVEGHLIVLSEDGRLHLVEATPEEFRAKASVTVARPDGTPLLRHPSWSPPVLSRGLLYLRGRDSLVALELIPQ